MIWQADTLVTIWSGVSPVAVEAQEVLFFFSSRRRHTRFDCDWSSDVCSSDLQFFIGEVRADFFVNLVGNVARDARDGFRLLLLNQARAARLRRIIRNRSDSAPLGTTQFGENWAARLEATAIKAKTKRRTRVSDPHVTSRGRGRPRHISIMRPSRLL